ncbi:MAG TPA: excinuclease ABC subunit UvrB [Anaerohalosphaeraceae bacterium]|mgnify:CR=1 FL=1|nr:excinuclease ABC subunit UvrB [Anaerohalosphaeraceae bacterium]HQG05633.1 excinuclease ABC subunit UvrB [Anaerohalosphaeraceae bacterium]HQI07311.1 excinuclease ABC subunit UvrB [Anaerohalosphaeraceae bacterium]HQJ67582.1 excinuclease ABC subunit UvrB [Anaerohalosphaeraceae bacterium]
MSVFTLKSPFQPCGDQPRAIAGLMEGLRAGKRCQTLLGVTGSGKTFTMANVIAQAGLPALVISHNKTLAAQLYEEFRELFPDNAVEYFVSYYDYYQPEAYIPQRDIYIEKDASRNDELDRLRLSATTSLMSRRDVIIVASVSCIFGLGSPADYQASVIAVRTGDTLDRNELLGRLADLQYDRNDFDFARGTFRVRGDVVELWPSYESYGVRFEFFGDEVEAIRYIHPVSADVLAEEQQIFIYPAKHYILPAERIEAACCSIEEELHQRLLELRHEGKLLEAQRLEARTLYDLEMIRQVGYCSGIENYARHMAGLKPGARPYTLIDYFPEDFLLFIDESHVTIPQLRAMYNGDRHRKEVLVEHGFRLPSALDNRPLRFEEFQERWKHVIFVSATPAPYELELCGGEVVEQIIRPTGLVDPEIFVHPASDQISHLIGEIEKRVSAHQRVLVTTLTKRLAEDLSGYLTSKGIRCRYLHSEIQTLERVEILRDLRAGEFDVLVGINLLREGLDLPEVSMVAILDADKEGFLRSETSLIQTIGRTARNVDAAVWLYADTITPSMQKAIDETRRRRTLQLEYNARHGITPQTIRKEIQRGLTDQLRARKAAQQAVGLEEQEYDRQEMIAQLEKEMLQAAEELEFERAARLRDQIRQLKELPEWENKQTAAGGRRGRAARSKKRN